MIAEDLLIHDLKQPSTRSRAFAELVDVYKERLYWHIRKIVLDHDDADDVLQNTFIKIFKNIASFKGDSKLFTWMYRIATNEALTFLKKKKKKLQINDGEFRDRMLANLVSDPYFEGDTIQLRLQEAIARLPEKQKLVFNMKYFEELKYTEISEILGTSVGGLKASYHLAVKKVEDYVKDHGDFEI